MSALNRWIYSGPWPAGASRKDGFDEGKNRCKFALRGLLTLPWTLRWLDTWRQQPALRQHLQANRGWPASCTALSLPLAEPGRQTRRALHPLPSAGGTVSPAAYRSLLDDAGLILAELNGKNDAEIKVRLTHQHSFDKGG